jgi:hypothetical protein
MSFAVVHAELDSTIAYLRDALERCKEEQEKARARERREAARRRRTTIRRTIFFPFAGRPWLDFSNYGMAQDKDKLDRLRREQGNNDDDPDDLGGLD